MVGENLTEQIERRSSKMPVMVEGQTSHFASIQFSREDLPCAKSYRQTPGAGRRVKVEIQGRQGNTTLTRRPATHNQNRIRARNALLWCEATKFGCGQFS